MAVSVKVPRRKLNGSCQNRHSKEIFSMSTGVPTAGGYVFEIDGQRYAFSTLELGLRSKNKKLICGPAALNMESTTKDQQLLSQRLQKNI